MKKSIRNKFLAVLCTYALMVSGAYAAETDHVKNGDFSGLTGISPLHWELYDGAMTEVPFRQPLSGAAETIQNGGLESGDGTPTGWVAYWGPWNGSSVKCNKDAARTGSYGVEISGRSNDEMTAYYSVTDIVPGAEYQVSAYAKIIQAGASAKLTISQYNGDEILKTTAVYVPDTATDWTQIHGNFAMSENCTKVIVAARVNGEGTLHFDDFSFYMTKAPARFAFETEDIFHYADRGVGKAHVWQNPYYDDVLQNASVDFSITDMDGKVLAEKESVPVINGAAAWDYSVEDFTMYEEYTLMATVTSNAGEDVFTQDIYKYPRPSALRADGTYIDENGDPFIPVIAYHPGDFERMAEIGVNVVEISAPNPEVTLESLNAAHALGLKALVSLFCGPAYMQPASHPDNITTTVEVVSAVYDHPAVFAYAVQDEPYGIGAEQHMDDYLTDAYKIIHAIDKEHPIYAVDFMTDGYGRLGKRVDVIATDLYPYQADSYKVSDSVRAAVNAVYGRKPVYCITQVFEGAGGYFPEVDAVRGQVYRALAEGAHGVGFYAISNAIGHVGGKPDQPLYDIEDRWEPMKNFAKEEFPLLLSHFGVGEQKLFALQDPGGNRGVYYRGWVENGKLYMAVHNRNTETKSVSILLTSQNGTVTVDGYRARRIHKQETESTYTGSTLLAELAGGEGVLYEITPNKAIDETKLTAATRKAADAYVRPSSSLKASVLPEEAEEHNAVIALNTKDAAMQQYIYDLRCDKNYALSIEYESGAVESARVKAEFFVVDDMGFMRLDTRKAKTGEAHIAGEESFEEKFGTAKGTDTYTVDFSIPSGTDAIKLTISAVKADAQLKIRKVSLTETEYNMLRNGSMQHVKAENRLSGGWSSYYEYPALYKNTVEVRKEEGISYLYMTEAETYQKGQSANARQKVALYEDKLYMLSFLYKDMGGAAAPTAGVSAPGGKRFTQSGETKAETNGWTRYQIYICPQESAMHTVWLGGPDAKGAYAFADVRLFEAKKEGVFLSPLSEAESTEGIPVLAKKIAALKEAESENGTYVVLLWQNNEACVATYGAEGNELAAFVPPSNSGGWTEYKVPAGGKLRVFVWQVGGMEPSKPCVTLK